MTVRPLRLLDGLAVTGVIRHLFPQCSGARIRRWLRDEPHSLAVALVQGRLVGVVRLQVHPGDGCTEIDLLGVLPSARGQGVGTALLRHAEQTACACGASCVLLGPQTVESAQQVQVGADGFFSRAGYVPLQPQDALLSGHDLSLRREGVSLQRCLKREVPMPASPRWGLREAHRPRVPHALFSRVVRHALLGFSAWAPARTT
ncbi:GNAT family N-acetyltransferase [Sphaerotilus hippei]|uniref:GNAT family N-acetyltransferase n=1 Tax=Sphaerotilus hippei TaxID=744406 RepID=UPI0014757E31|nr:GNAT family N-acetyltransferase [Sphaerotilus hippei]